MMWKRNVRDLEAKGDFPQADEGIQDQKKCKNGLNGVEAVPLSVNSHWQSSASNEVQCNHNPNSKNPTRWRFN